MSEEFKNAILAGLYDSKYAPESLTTRIIDV